MSRADLQTIAQARIEDAQVLLNADRWSGAYYLAGYAVEVALKSCILAYIETTGILFKNKEYTESLGKKIWIHDLARLTDAANLKNAIEVETRINLDFGTNWDVVKRWDETTRYHQKSEKEARELFEAITHNINGVLPWLRARW